MSLIAFTTECSGLSLFQHRAYPVTTSGTPGNVVTLAPPTITPASVSTAGVVASYVTTLPHRLTNGQRVGITGELTYPQFNGAFVVTVADPTHFSVTLPSAPGGNATAANVRINWRAQAQWALLKAPAANTADVSFGPDANADYDTISAGAVYQLPIQAIDGKFDLATFSIKSVDASQVLNVLFI